MDCTVGIPEQGKAYPVGAVLQIKGSTDPKAVVRLNGGAPLGHNQRYPAIFLGEYKVQAGANTLTLTCTKGSQNITKNFSFTAQPPGLFITQPGNNSLWAEGTQAVFTLGAWEAATVTVGGVPTTRQSNGALTATYRVGAGTQTVEVVAQDEFGNRKTATRTLTGLRNLAVATPAENDQVVAGVPLSLNIQADPGERVTLNQTLLSQQAGGVYQPQVTPQMGTNTLTVTAGPAGGAARQTVQRKVEGVAVTFAINMKKGDVTVLDGWDQQGKRLVAQTSHVPAGTVLNLSGAKGPGQVALVINGQALGANALFSQTYTVTPGKNEIVAEAWVGSGQNKLRRVLEVYGLSPLVVEVPSSGDVFAPGAQVQVRGKADPQETVWVKGITANRDTQGGFTAQVVIQNGQNEVLVAAGQDKNQPRQTVNLSLLGAPIRLAATLKTGSGEIIQGWEANGGFVAGLKQTAPQNTPLTLSGIVSPPTAKLKIAGEMVTPGSSGFFSAPVSAKALGNNAFLVEAWLANNPGEKVARTLQVWGKKKLVLSSPQPGARFLPGQTVTVEGQADPQDQVRVQGVLAQRVGESGYKATLTMPATPTDLTLTAGENVDANEQSLAATLQPLTPKWQMALKAPGGQLIQGYEENGQLTQGAVSSVPQGSALVLVGAYDPVPANLSIDGVVHALSSPLFSFPVTAEKQGKAQWLVEAWPTGSTARATRALEVNVTAPLAPVTALTVDPLPGPGPFPAGAALNITGKAHASAQVSVDGAPAQRAAETFTRAYFVKPGGNTLRITATQPGIATQEKTFTLTGETVLLTVDKSAENTTLPAGQPVVINGQAWSAATVKIGATVIKTPGKTTFSHTRMVTNGRKELLLEATDSFGNRKTVTLVLTGGAAAAPVSFEEKFCQTVLGGQYQEVYQTRRAELRCQKTFRPELDLGGFVVEENLAAVLVEGQAKPLQNDGRFTHRAKLKVGVNRFLLEAHDKAGHHSALEVVIRRTQAQEEKEVTLGLQSPAPDSYTLHRQVTFLVQAGGSVSSLKNASLALQVNGTLVRQTLQGPGTVSLPVTAPFPVGEHLFHLSLTAADGQRADLHGRFTVEQALIYAKPTLTGYGLMARGLASGQETMLEAPGYQPPHTHAVTGQEVAYVKLGLGGKELWVKPFQGAAQKIWTSPWPIRQLAISPTGQRLLVVQSRPEGYALVSLKRSANGQVEKADTFPVPAEGYLGHPVWHPDDETQAVVTVYQEGGSLLAKVEAAGVKITPLLKTAGGFDPGWLRREGELFLLLKKATPDGVAIKQFSWPGLKELTGLGLPQEDGENWGCLWVGDGQNAPVYEEATDNTPLLRRFTPSVPSQQAGPLGEGVCPQ